MNRFQKKILTIAAGVANIGLALSAAAVATYAWFAVNANVNIFSNNASASAISIAQSDGQLTYEILKYDDNVKAGVSSTNPNDFYLPDYDSYITERNVYANAIIRAEIFTPVDTDSEQFIIDVSRLASAFKQNGAVQSYTSNVIQFKATVFSYKLSGSQSYTHNTASSDNIDETSAATKYATASAYFASRETPTTFVQIRDNSDGSSVITRKAEADTITLVPSLPDELNIDSCIIYIECSYHQKLVEEYIATNEAAELSHHSLSGDISSILFSHRTKTSNTSNATGRYVKVQSSTLAATGSYLPTYEYDTLQGKVLDGEKADTNTAESSSLPINSAGNYKTVDINSPSGSIPKSIDSTDDIDASAFAYARQTGTLQSSSGMFVGHSGANSNGIKVNADSTNLGNDITFSNGQASVTSQANPARKLQFNSANNGDKFAYYTSAQQNIDLYRYSENVSEMPTVTSISVDSSEAIKTFYTNHTFEIAGLVVTASYSDGTTADVTGACTFTSNTTPTKLVPGSTVFTAAAASKTVTVNYVEGNFSSSTNSYTITVIAEAVTSISVSGSLTNQYYYVGDTFSSAGISVIAHYNSGIADADVTAQATFTGYSMSSAGNYAVTANYDGLTASAGTIHVIAKAISISATSLTIAEGVTNSNALTVTYNLNVSIAQSSNNGGSVTFSPSSITYSGSNKANQSRVISITGVNAGTVTLTFSANGATSKTCTITVTQVPADHFSITSGDIVSGTSYGAHTISSYNIGNNRTADWVITYGGNNNSVGTNSGNRSNCNLSSYSKYAVSPVTTSTTAAAFASTTSLNKIKSISFNYDGGSNPTSTVYALYSSDNSSFSKLTTASGSFAQGGTMNTSGTEYTFTFDQAYTGYFALVFVATNSSGAWRIDDVNVTFNPVTLSSISLGGDLNTKAFTDGDSITNFSGLTVTATYGDSTSEVIDNSAIEWTVSPSTLSVGTTSVTITASYTLNGVTKTSSKTITGITVSAKLITSITLTANSSSISVGGTTTVSVAISPSTATNQSITITFTAGGGSVGKFDSSSGSSTTKTVACSNGTGTFTVYGVAAGTMSFRASANDGSGITSSVTSVTVTSSSQKLELTFDLTSNPGGWPTTNSSTATNYSYTLGGVTYTFSLKNVKQNSGYLMMTSTAALGLPAISGKKLTKVVAYNSSSCSTSTRVGISSSNSSASYITGGSYKTWSTTSSSYTYTLSGTSNNTMYYLYVTNKNAQVIKLVLTYE